MPTILIRYTSRDEEDYVVALIDHKGERVELIDPAHFDLQRPEQMFSRLAPWLELPLPLDRGVSHALRLEQQASAWEPVISSSVYGEIVRRFRLSSAKVGSSSQAVESSLAVPAFAEAKAALGAIKKLHTVISTLAPLMMWAKTASVDGGNDHGLSPLPPLGLLPAVTNEVLKIGDGFAKLLALAVLHAIGQEAVLLAEGYGEHPEEPLAQSPARCRRWFDVLQEWLKYLDSKSDGVVPVKFVLPRINDDGRTRWRGSWLPSSTIRTISFQIKKNLVGKQRDDFISRIGMESPWDVEPVWGLKAKRKQDVVYCDPWPRPLDHIHWWQVALNCIGMKLIEEALMPNQFRAWDEFKVDLPWFRQSMAATVALAHSAEQFVGRKMLTKAAAAGVEIGAAPNTLIPSEARLINKPFVSDPGEIWQVANDPGLLMDERVSTPVVDGITYNDAGKSLANAGRNLANDVKTSLARLEEFRHIRSEEARMLIWWRDLKPFVHAEFLEATFGHGWPWDNQTSLKMMLNEDYPPTVRCKGGWLPWVIAMKARNRHLPPNFAVPTEAELAGIGVDQDFDEEALDVMITRAGMIEGQDPFQAARRPSAQRAVRQLVLQGWHGKANAKKRALQWLASSEPDQGRGYWYTYVTICVSIALARWIHPKGSIPKDREKLIKVLRHRHDEAEKQDDSLMNASAVWIDAFLMERVALPV